MPDFLFHFQAAMDRRGIDRPTLRKLMGKKNPSAVNNLFNGKGNPTLSMLEDICDALGDCSLDEITGRSPIYSVEAIDGKTDHIARKIASLMQDDMQSVLGRLDRIVSVGEFAVFGEFLAFWMARGGMLVEMSKFSETVDTYYTPDSDSSQIKLHKMGRLSAAAKEFNYTETQELNRELEKLPEDVNITLAHAQRLTVESKQPMFTLEKLELPGLSVIYLRLLTPWLDDFGRSYVKNLSIPVRGQILKSPIFERLFTEPSKLSLLDSH